MDWIRRQDWAFASLLAGAFCMGFSMPAGRIFLVLCLLLLTVDILRKKRRLYWPTSAWLWVAFLALAAVVTWHGINPEKGVGRLDKLFWYVGLPLAATLADSRVKCRRLLIALLWGFGLLALRILTRNPAAAEAVSKFAATVHLPVDYWQALIDRGSLIDGQRMMIGLVGATALLLTRAPVPEVSRSVCITTRAAEAPIRSLSFKPWPILIGLLALAEILTFKRGSWLCAAGLLFLLLWRRLSWRQWVLAGVLLAAVVLALPPARQRILNLRREFSLDSGGRMTLWFRIAPPLLREHPWGVGFRSLSNHAMREVAREVGCRHLERNRDHMHSNLVETAVSVGWAGLALYLAWMAVMLRDAWQAGSRPRIVLWMLAAIFLNGLVEYNFADAEIVIILGLLGGLAAAERRLEKTC